MESPAPTLSVCLIARDEEKYLDRCLQSVRGFVDEIILVDTDSTDRTREIAASYGARVFSQAWQDDFARARNAALEQARGNWILQLDADEALAPGDGPRLKSWLQGSDADGLLVVIRNFAPSGSLADYYDALQLRLFRNRREFRYQNRIHEQIYPSIQRSGGRIAASDLRLDHYGYLSATAQAGVNRAKRNLGLLEQAAAEDPGNTFLQARLGLNYFELEQDLPAQDCLLHALAAPDAPALDKTLLIQIHTALAKIAIRQDDFAQAIHRAQACLALDREDARSLQALSLLAEAQMKLAESRLRAALNAAPTSDLAASDPTTGPAGYVENLQAFRAGLQQASLTFMELLRHPRLSPQAASQVAASLQRCQQMLESSAKLASPGQVAETDDSARSAAQIAAHTAAQQASGTAAPAIRAPLLSLCMIVKNEAHNLARCLDSVTGVVDEIVLVDTGSTDRTLEIAAQYGARVFHHTWQNDFSQARNAALEQARGEWILHLDADEALAPESHPRLRPLLAEVRTEGLWVCVRSFNPPGSVEQYTDASQVRLFRRRTEHRYEQSIHEQIIFSIRRAGGQAAPSELRIWHYGSMQENVQGNLSRNQRNRQMLEQACAREPSNPYLHATLGLTYFNLGEHGPAETAVQKALFELDARTLNPELVEEALLVLAYLASLRRDAAHTIRCVQAAQKARPAAEPSPRELLLLANAYLQAADALKAGGQPQLVGDRGQPLSSRWLYLAAQEHLQRLESHPRLGTDLQPKVAAGLQRCQAALGAENGTAGDWTPADVLRFLLGAEDIRSALEAWSAYLDRNLLDLVLANAAAAHSQGETELAAGLEDLAAYIEQEQAGPG